MAFLRKRSGSADSAVVKGKKVEAHFTVSVFMTCMVAACAGLLFGWDNGIMGGVTSEESFQKKFLYSTYEANYVNRTTTTPYCKYSSQTFSLITSILYIAAFFAAPMSAVWTRFFGRKWTIFTAGVFFGIGAAIQAAAQNYAMIIVGRAIMGCGVGFANSAAPAYLSEIAPPQWRGLMTIMFQLIQCMGIMLAYITNYGTHFAPAWGWRLSLGLAGAPALIVILGSLCLNDTPNSLLNRGKPEEARWVLEKARGTHNVDVEFAELEEAASYSRRVGGLRSFTTLLKPQYRPQLYIATVMGIFQQWTGSNSIYFYTPQLFSQGGSDQTEALAYTCIIGAVNVGATFVSVIGVDWFGRKPLLIEGGIQMAVCMFIIAAVQGVEFNRYPSGVLPGPPAKGLLAVYCVFVAAFAWSFGPLGWLVPVEVQTLETRSAGAAINTSMNMAMTVLITQFFQEMLCAMSYGVFIFFGCLICIWVTLIWITFPEPKDVPVEEVYRMFGRHRFWGKFPAVRELAARGGLPQQSGMLTSNTAYEGTNGTVPGKVSGDAANGLATNGATTM